jgi:hypothetical protein
MTFDAPERGGLGGIVLPLEGNRWIVTLVGRHGEKPPDDSDGFLAFAQRLRTPTIYNAIKKAEQLGKIARFGFPPASGGISTGSTSSPAGCCLSAMRYAGSIPSTAKA